MKPKAKPRVGDKYSGKFLLRDRQNGGRERKTHCFTKFPFSPCSNLELNNPGVNKRGDEESLNFLCKSQVPLMSVFLHSVQMGLEADQFP